VAVASNIVLRVNASNPIPTGDGPDLVRVGSEVPGHSISNFKFLSSVNVEKLPPGHVGPCILGLACVNGINVKVLAVPKKEGAGSYFLCRK
jgi:hypothetical protein